MTIIDKDVVSLPYKINMLAERYDEAASNVFRQHGITGKFRLDDIEIKFESFEDETRFKELGADEYFVPLVEEELKKVTFVHRLKGSHV